MDVGRELGTALRDGMLLGFIVFVGTRLGLNVDVGLELGLALGAIDGFDVGC